MSTLKADTVTTKSDNTDLTLTGGGTGVPNLETGFKVGGTAGVPVNNLRTGTDGELITWDASGDPATVAVGTATHVLTSNGAGAAPTFQAASGGAYTFISSVTPSASATIEFTSNIDSTYATYFFLLENLDHSADGQLKFLLGTGATPTYQTANYDQAGFEPQSTSTSYNERSEHDNTYTYLINSGASDSEYSGSRWNGFLYLYSPSDSASLTYFQSCLTSNSESGGIRLSFQSIAGCWHGGATSPSHTPVTAVKFYPGSGTFTSGKISMYGISTS